MKFRSFSSIAVAAILAYAGSANALFINGSITASGAVTNLPATPSTSLVTALASVSTGGFQGGNGTGDITPASGPIAPFTFTVDLAPQAIFTYGAFTFTVFNWGTKTVNPFSCTTSQCSDGVSYADVSGSVDDGVGGFDATAFSAGSFSYSGVCNNDGAGGTSCLSASTAGWTGQFAAQGVAAPPPPGLPEPSALALVGLALAGLALSRKSKKA